ncbi:MAG: GNAT family N-acetyltransferase [Spirochaetota bacterium]
MYTPKAHRRHGYARACVAELTARLIEAGRQFCFLFTDLSNPTSNKIYQQIGYRPVSDHVYWKFEPPA